MKKYLKILLSMVIGVIAHADPSLAQQATLPVTPSPYFEGTILPNVARKDLDNILKQFYNDWKGKYLDSVPGKDQNYIHFVDPHHPNQICISEGQGYGMLITVLMAKFDPTAKRTYDRLLNYRLAHESSPKTHMMSWKQKANFRNMGKSAATDGDLDIAYSLLLASRQWPSPDSIYFKSAAKVINNIMANEINNDQWTILLGDEEQHIKVDPTQGVKEYTSDNWWDTRTSDFMPATFKEFARFDPNWLKVVHSEYDLFYHLQFTYSKAQGLIPDFVRKVNDQRLPPAGYFKETNYDGQYYNNACRIPWRVGIDYLQNGDDSAKACLTRINRWIKDTTKQDTSRVYAGYFLSGTPIDTNNERFYSSPFTVSAMIDKNNQAWLNKLWVFIAEPHDFMYGKGKDYYGDCINMLDMIIITGNYWPAFKK